jgi:RNA recognition motif-containing protein
MNIFVGSLPFSIDDADLRESFEVYGTVNSVKIITDKFTGRSKGFGFVEMENDTEAEKAIQELNGATIVVNKSEPKPEGERKPYNNNRSGGSGGGYNGGGNSRGGGSYSGGNSSGGNKGRY